MPAHGSPSIGIGWLAFIGGVGLLIIIIDWWN
jgi:hypothetical protein